MHLHLETYLYFSDGSFLNQSSLNITHSSVYIIHHTKNTFCSHNKQLKKIAPLLSRTSPYHSLTLHNNLAVNISSSEHIFRHNFHWLHLDTNTSGSHRFSVCSRIPPLPFVYRFQHRGYFKIMNSNSSTGQRHCNMYNCKSSWVFTFRQIFER